METCFYRAKREKDYTVIDNTCLRDARLSWKAKGLLCYLLSLPDGWEIHLSEIVKHSTDGKTALSNAIAELVADGYLQKEQTKDTHGRFSACAYRIYETPQPCTENPCTENPSTGNHPLVNTDIQNTDVPSTKNIKNIKASNLSEFDAPTSFFRKRTVGIALHEGAGDIHGYH